MELQDRVEESKRKAFLRRACELASWDPHCCVASGELGQELGLPYEQTLGIVDDLQRRGWLQRDDELLPPRGPMTHVTRRGLRAARWRRA